MFMWHRILIKNVLVILKSFLTFSSNFFFAQPTFVFHLWGDFCIVHVFIVTFFFYFRKISIPFTSFFCSLYLFFVGNVLLLNL